MASRSDGSLAAGRCDACDAQTLAFEPRSRGLEERLVVIDDRAADRHATRRSARALPVLSLLRFFAALDDVSFSEEDRLQRDPPVRRSPDQELEVHAEVLELIALEVLELLALGVGHDRLRLRVGLERHSLLVPSDRLR